MMESCITSMNQFREVMICIRPEIPELDRAQRHPK